MSPHVRRHGFAGNSPILQRLRQCLGVRLQVRLASMVRVCLPRLTGDELALLGGGGGLRSAGAAHAPRLVVSMSLVPVKWSYNDVHMGSR